MSDTSFEQMSRSEALDYFFDVWGIGDDHCDKQILPDISIFIDENGNPNESVYNIMMRLKIHGIEIENSYLNWSHNLNVLTYLIDVYSRDGNIKKLPATNYDFEPSISTYSGIIEG